VNNGQTARISVVLADMAMETHGGVADSIANLANRLRQYGVCPIVLLHNPVSNDHPYVRFMRKQGVPVWAVSEAQAYVAVRVFQFLAFCLWPVAIIDAWLRRKTLAASRQSVWGVLRRVGYWGVRAIFCYRLCSARVIHRAGLVHFFKPDMWPALQWMKLMRLKTLYTEETDPLKETLYYYAGLRGHKSCLDKVTAVSSASAHGIQSILGEPGKIPVIPNMVDLAFPPSEPLSQYVPVAEHCAMIGLIARLSPEKDVDTFLQACQRVLVRIPRAQFVIAGDGPERSRLTDLSRRLGIEEAVTFAGAFAKEDLPEIMAELDIVALSSMYEGLPVALLEAMAFGKPVVATAVGGVPEVVEDGVTGFLVPPHSPDALADALCHLIGDTELRLRMGFAGRKRYQDHFTPEAVVPQYVEVYRSLLHGTADQ